MTLNLLVYKIGKRFENFNILDKYNKIIKNNFINIIY